MTGWVTTSVIFAVMAGWTLIVGEYQISWMRGGWTISRENTPRAFRLSIAIAIALALICAGMAVYRSWSPFPLRDADEAIALARQVCGGKADPSLKWQAFRVDGVWAVSTQPSAQKSGDSLWIVRIPIDGPLPAECRETGR